MKFNSGEWSELYAFLKIIEQRNLPAAKSDLSVIPNVSYPVTKVKRDDKSVTRTYDLSDNSIFKVSINSEEKITEYDIAYKDVTNELPSILRALKAKKNSKGSFELPEATTLIDLLQPGKIKQSSRSKEDITLVLRDHITSQESLVGFSIKSYIGGKATLLNASYPTHFRFSVKNNNTDYNIVNKITGVRKLRRRVNTVILKGGEINFDKMLNPIFEKNLRKIDSFLPEIIGELLKAFFTSKGNRISDLTQHIIDQKCLKGPILENFDFDDIKFKLKQLLLNAALGMVPATDWDGVIKADGGYVIVRSDGEVVCYHVYNISDLSEYLFNNTKLDTPSSGRHPFAVFFTENGKDKYDYPLQIRFS